MKVLIIRFSSIGDLTQALSIPGHIRQFHPEAEIQFVTRQDLSGLLENNPNIQKIWRLDRKKGLGGLRLLIQQMKNENFTHIYDAHNNLRSFLIRLFVPATHKLVRPMMRFKRFLLIRFQINLFEKPFSGQRDLLKPLEKWQMPFSLPKPPQLFLTSAEKQKAQEIVRKNGLMDYVVLAPSAAYFLKRWPLDQWKKLIQLNPKISFLILAGPTDDFTHELNGFPNIVNLTGQTSLRESAALIEGARAVVANDTGLLHFAEQLGKPAIALMGPAPFGFPSRPSTKVLERNLPCRPCSKHGQGPCVNPNYHECLKSISSEEVSSELQQILLGSKA
jgi:ADP-heptose:LPS heptosyltransferase